MVKCIDCGFLAERQPGPYPGPLDGGLAPAQPEYIEVTVEGRRGGAPGDGWFQCFADHFDLAQEADDVAVRINEGDEWRLVTMK